MVGEVYLEWEERKSDGSPNISILILSLCFSSSYPQLSELFVYIFFSILSSKWLAGRRSINPNMVVYIGAALRCKKLHCIAIYIVHMDQNAEMQHSTNFSAESAMQIADICILQMLYMISFNDRQMKRTVMHHSVPQCIYMHCMVVTGQCTAVICI